MANHVEADVEAWTRRLVDEANQQRLPDLFCRTPPGAMYHVPDRAGIAVVVLRTTDLSPTQRMGLLKYRLGQYLAAGLFDPVRAHKQRLEFEPVCSLGPNDVHVLAGSSGSGGLLCYVTLRASGEAASRARLRQLDRALFPVEQLVGWGVFNRLPILPDLLVANVREGGRLVKSQSLSRRDERAIRAPIEVLLAATRTLTGGLRGEVDAVVGILEEHVAKRNLDFFHIPTVVIRGVLPYVPGDSISRRFFQEHACYPFALLVSDLESIQPRLDAIERALALPGQQGVAALLALKADSRASTSSLEPSRGLPRLAATPLAEQRGDMELGLTPPRLGKHPYAPRAGAQTA